MSKIRVAILLMLLPLQAYAQLQSSQPIRLVVPFAPGGGSDVTARLIAPKIGEGTGSSVVVDNRPGASGVIGTEIVMRSPPDGHTLVLIDTAHTVNKILSPNTPYDPIKDFTAVSMVAITPLILVVHPSLPVKTAVEFVSLARAQPGKLTMGSAGAGTSSHLGGELLRIVTNTQWVHVPYKGSGPALTDLVGGQLQAFVGPLPGPIGLIKGGKLKALAVTSEQRARLLPDVPTLGELGIGGAIVNNWYGILGPAKIPPKTVATLAAAIANGVATAEMRERLATLALEPKSSTPKELDTLLHEETIKWRNVITQAKIKLE